MTSIESYQTWSHSTTSSWSVISWLFLDLSQVGVLIHNLLVKVMAINTAWPCATSSHATVTDFWSSTNWGRSLVMVYDRRWSSFSDWVHHMKLLILRRLLHCQVLMLKIVLLVGVIWKVIVFLVQLTVLQAVYRSHEVNLWFEELLSLYLLVNSLLRVLTMAVWIVAVLVRRVMIRVFLLDLLSSVRLVVLALMDRLVVKSHLWHLLLRIITLVVVWDIASHSWLIYGFNILLLWNLRLYLWQKTTIER